MSYIDKYGNEQYIKCNGIFIKIGQQPNSHIVSEFNILNKYGEIITNNIVIKIMGAIAG